MSKTTFGVIVGNRGFFPDMLAKEGRKNIIDVLKKNGIRMTPDELIAAVNLKSYTEPLFNHKIPDRVRLDAYYHLQTYPLEVTTYRPQTSDYYQVLIAEIFDRSDFSLSARAQTSGDRPLFTNLSGSSIPRCPMIASNFLSSIRMRERILASGEPPNSFVPALPPTTTRISNAIMAKSPFSRIANIRVSLVEL